MAESNLLFMENENFTLVDALPYIDTQLGSTEVAQQVKAIIEEEMKHFEPRDYLQSLPVPELPILQSELLKNEFARMDAGHPLSGIDFSRYEAAVPQGPDAEEEAAWKRANNNLRVIQEYDRLRLTNLEMLEKWGSKAWVAHSVVVRASERVLANEASGLKATREEVNKKRKLEQISCGNELRKLTRELEQYQHDNNEVNKALQVLAGEIGRLREAAKERGVATADIDPDANPAEKIEEAQEPVEVAETIKED